MYLSPSHSRSTCSTGAVFDTIHEGPSCEGERVAVCAVWVRGEEARGEVGAPEIAPYVPGRSAERSRSVLATAAQVVSTQVRYQQRAQRGGSAVKAAAQGTRTPQGSWPANQQAVGARQPEPQAPRAR